MSRLRFESLEDRAVPAALWDGVGWAPEMRHPIPGWTGDVRVVTIENEPGHFGNAFVAGTGGSARVVVRNEFGDISFDHVFLDPNFRGGADMTTIGNKLYVAPLVGGGDQVQEYDLSALTITSYALGFGEGFRGGMTLTSFDSNQDGSLELFALPIEGAPHFISYDPATKTQVMSFFVGPETDTRQYKFVPAGTQIQVHWSEETGPIMGMALQIGDDASTTFLVGYNGVFYDQAIRPEDFAAAV